jgi:hypothetical protein
MSFERGIGVKESMEIGRKKDAIKLSSVKIYSNNNQTILTDPYVVEKFLESFSKFSIPNDPIFGPQRIVFTCLEKRIEIDDMSNLRAAMGLAPIDTDYSKREVEVEEDRNLSQCVGKTIIFGSKMYAIPTFDELMKNGFEHLQICEENNTKKEDDERDKAMRISSMQLDSMKKMMYANAPSDLTKIAANDPILGLKNKMDEIIRRGLKKKELNIKKKRKKFFIFDIETRIK